jgi:hypothetical protein
LTKDFAWRLGLLRDRTATVAHKAVWPIAQRTLPVPNFPWRPVTSGCCGFHSSKRRQCKSTDAMNVSLLANRLCNINIRRSYLREGMSFPYTSTTTSNIIRHGPKFITNLILIPFSSYCPALPPGCTQATCPLSDNCYIKRPNLIGYNEDSDLLHLILQSGMYIGDLHFYQAVADELRVANITALKKPIAVTGRQVNFTHDFKI